jgi:hypothetical protein
MLQLANKPMFQIVAHDLHLSMNKKLLLCLTILENLVTAEHERCSVPRSGNGPFGTELRERNHSHSVKIASKASFPFPDRRSLIRRSENSGDYAREVMFYQQKQQPTPSHPNRCA